MGEREGDLRGKPVESLKLFIKRVDDRVVGLAKKVVCFGFSDTHQVLEICAVKRRNRHDWN